MITHFFISQSIRGTISFVVEGKPTYRDTTFEQGIGFIRVAMGSSESGTHIRFRKTELHQLIHGCRVKGNRGWPR